MRRKSFISGCGAVLYWLVWSNTAVAQPSLWSRIEDSMGGADSAFAGILKWHEVRRPYENIIRASGTVFPSKVIWGELPKSPIDIGEKEFLVHGGSSMWTIWDGLGAVREGIEIPLLFLSRGQGADLEIVCTVGADQTGTSPVPGDLLTVRALETKRDGPELREQLIAAVIRQESSEVLWTYALRKLYLLEEDPERQFDLVLDSRIQEKAPYAPSKGDAGGGRLWYATRLLTRQIPVRAGDQFHQPTSEELRATYEKLLDVFEDTPSAYMGETVIDRFDEQPARKAEFSDQEWSRIRARIRAALDNPEHPFHKLPAERQATVQSNIERVMKEPNPFASEK